MSHELLCKLLNAGIGHAQTMRKTELLGSGMSWHTAGMKALFALACIALTGIVIADPLPRASPESQGVASSALDTVFKKLSEIDAVHSTMIVRHGQVIAEGWWQPYTAQRRHKLYSLSKSFTSTAVGMAIAEGKLSLDDTVVSFFPEHAPASPSYHLKNMRIRDLLSMSTGHVGSDLQKFSFAESDGPLAKAFLHLPVAHKPGTHFLYNTPATYMCSAIVQRVTGKTAHDYLKARLFPQLGIEDSHWETCPERVSLGGYGLNVKTEDIAKLGQLYLQKGEWRGQRLLPADWVAAATARQTSNGSNPNNDWDQGYGYQFWRCRYNAYRGDGAFGQFCLVLPDQDTVVAITSGTSDMQGVMNVIWEYLLPALAPVAIPENAKAQSALSTYLSNLKLPNLKGNPMDQQVAPFLNKRYQFAENSHGVEELIFVQKDGRAQLAFRMKGKAASMQDLGLALNTRLDPQSSAKTVSQAAWSSPETLIYRTYYTRTPYTLTLHITFKDNRISLQPEWNVAFGPKKLTPLKGTLTQ